MRISLPILGIPSGQQVGGGGTSYTQGDGLTATTMIFRGASNIEGNQDGDGITLITRAQSRVANPAVLFNAGIGGASNAQCLTKYETTHAANDSTGDPASYKTPFQLIQLFGVNDSSTLPRPRIANVKQFLVDFAGNSVPDYLIANGVNPYTGKSPSSAWMDKRLVSLIAQANWPGRYVDICKYTSSPAYFPVLTAHDAGYQAVDALPKSYESTGTPGHCNGIGYNAQSDAWTFPLVRAVAGVLPYCAFQDVLATASTANTAAGFVADVNVIGDLTGVTVDLVSHQTLFNVAVQATGATTSKIRFTRNAGGVINDAFSDVQVRFTKGTVRDVYYVRLGIIALDDNCHEVSWTSTGLNESGDTSGCFYGMDEVSSNVDVFANTTQFSWFIKFRPLTGAVGISYKLTDGGSTGVNLGSVTATGAMSCFIRNGTTTTSVITHNVTSTVKADSTDKEICIFGCVDTVTGVAYFRYEFISHSAPAGVTFVEPANNGALPGSSPLGVKTITQRMNSSINLAVPLVHGATWEASGDGSTKKGFLDFRQAANRDLFRDPTTLALRNNYDRANFDQVTSVAGTGSGDVIRPHVSIRGNASERIMGKANRGNGITTTVDTNDTGQMAVAYAGVTILTET